MNVLVTGGAGFIGSALVRSLIRDGHRVTTIDKLTYAGNMDSLANVSASPQHCFVREDICDAAALATTFAASDPEVVFHLAAESHVDRSIDGPGAFVMTNLVGTFQLLNASLQHWRSQTDERRERFRFVHVSTDEVFGSLHTDGLFSEDTPYDPSSPYSASKAGSDHLVRAWHRTYGLPTLLSNCSNNYGPYQFPEKLIPLSIVRALAGQSLPVYGTGANVRDWLYVEDHASALRSIAQAGKPGNTYLVGGRSERSNIDVVRSICRILDQERPLAKGKYEDRIEFVPDRPGHDYRYAIDPTKLERELGWRATCEFDDGLRNTVRWYLEADVWLRRVLSGDYRAGRLGLTGHA